MMTLFLALLVLYLVVAPFLLWCDYGLVMNLKRVRDLGLMTPAMKYLGGYVLLRGYFHDLVVNLVHMSLLLGEFPRELTVTARLRRHIEQGVPGYRQHVCLLMRTQLLDNLDPNGIHR
jgi:hypothetical protein